MIARTISKACLVILLNFLFAASAYPEEIDLDAFLDDIEAQVHNKLSEYDTDKKVRSLQEAHKILWEQNYPVNHKDWREKVNRVLELRLLLIDKCFKERDCTYDFDDPSTLPSSKVAPPLWAGEHQIIIAGMRPEDVKDPEARRQYEEAIAENNRKIEKFRREKGLQDIIDREIYRMELYMYGIQQNPERQNSMWNLIETLIESDILRNKLREALERAKKKYEKYN